MKLGGRPRLAKGLVMKHAESTSLGYIQHAESGARTRVEQMQDTAIHTPAPSGLTRTSKHRLDAAFPHVSGQCHVREVRDSSACASNEMVQQGRRDCRTGLIETEHILREVNKFMGQQGRRDCRTGLTAGRGHVCTIRRRTYRGVAYREAHRCQSPPSGRRITACIRGLCYCIMCFL